MFPPVVEPGKPTQVTIYGRNLPNGQPADGFTADGRPLEKITISVTPPADAVGKLTSFTHVDPVNALQDGFAYTLKGPGGLSNPVVIYLARDKMTVKTVSASTPETAAVLNGPGEIAGFLAKKGERDWIAFTAKKGEKFTITLDAERIGASGDFFFSVRDGKDPKKDLSGEQDDDNDILHPFGFYTRTSDPGVYTFTAPDDGKYYVVVGCRESSYLSGPKAAYRLRIGAPMPDFRAVVMPYSRFYQTGSTVWQGGTQAYYVFAHRIDGYTGTLEVVAEGLPAGVTAKPLMIGPAARWGVLVLNVAGNAAPATTPITVKITGTDCRRQNARACRPPGFCHLGHESARPEHSRGGEARSVARGCGAGRESPVQPHPRHGQRGCEARDGQRGESHRPNHRDEAGREGHRAREGRVDGCGEA